MEKITDQGGHCAVVDNDSFYQLQNTSILIELLDPKIIHLGLLPMEKIKDQGGHCTVVR